MKQLSLFSTRSANDLYTPTSGKRKIKRPLATRVPVHLILRSSKHDLRKHERAIRKNWEQLAQLFGVKTYRMVVNSDHIHAIVRLHSQNLYSRFIQGFTGKISKSIGIRWLSRPTTRIAKWGRDFKRLCQYLKLNQLEAEGHIDYQADRTRKLPKWLKL